MLQLKGSRGIFHLSHFFSRELSGSLFFMNDARGESNCYFYLFHKMLENIVF